MLASITASPLPGQESAQSLRPSLRTTVFSASRSKVGGRLGERGVSGSAGQGPVQLAGPDPEAWGWRRIGMGVAGAGTTEGGSQPGGRPCSSPEGTRTDHTRRGRTGCHLARGPGVLPMSPNARLFDQVRADRSRVPFCRSPLSPLPLVEEGVPTAKDVPGSRITSGGRRGASAGLQPGGKRLRPVRTAAQRWTRAPAPRETYFRSPTLR